MLFRPPRRAPSATDPEPTRCRRPLRWPPQVRPPRSLARPGGWSVPTGQCHPVPQRRAVYSRSMLPPPQRRQRSVGSSACAEQSLLLPGIVIFGIRGCIICALGRTVSLALGIGLALGALASAVRRFGRRLTLGLLVLTTGGPLRHGRDHAIDVTDSPVMPDRTRILLQEREHDGDGPALGAGRVDRGHGFGGTVLGTDRGDQAVILGRDGRAGCNRSAALAIHHRNQLDQPISTFLGIFA